MGGVVSSLGFNQPFVLALLGIVLMLALTVMAVSGDPEPVHHYDIIPQIRVRAPTAAPRKTV